MEKIKTVKEKIVCPGHNWKLYRDTSLTNSGYLSFYCVHCLELRLVPKYYKEIKGEQIETKK